jgi:chemotaxis protein MotB
MADKFTPKEEAEESSPNWLITYGDMVTLLLVFFILLFSFGRIDDIRFQNAIKSVRGALGVIKGMNSVMQKGETPMKKILNGAMDLAELDDFFKKFKTYVADNKMENTANLTFNEQGVVISLTDMSLFKAGSADLDEHGKKTLAEVLPLIQMFPYEVNVVGHADASPIKTKRYPSNWELSLDRAMKVKQFFVSQDPNLEKKFSVTAFGSNRPLVLGKDEIQPELNRRVDIVLKRPSIDDKKKQ